MKPLLYSLSLILTLGFAKAQNYPYLNASTGNTNEFVVDADSNIFMFHSTRIEKLDKNFKPIWIKNYSDLQFKNLLLSKTGGLYFIAAYTGYDVIGKVDAAGNLKWCKALPNFTATVSGSPYTATFKNANQLLLDRNNHLIITGIAQPFICLLKLDTLGNFIKLRILTNDFVAPSQSMIINDINGIYTVSSLGYGFEGPVNLLICNYADLADKIISDQLITIGYMGHPQTHRSNNERILKSKNQSDVFYVTNSLDPVGSFSGTFTARKYKDSTLIWGIQFETSIFMSIEHIEEDYLKNTFLSVSVKIPWSTNVRDIWIVKVDSNGISDNRKNNFIQNFSTGLGTSSSGVVDSVTQFNRHYGNKFFYSIETSKSIPGPLSITKMDSTMGSYCTLTPSISVTSVGGPTHNLNGTTTTFTAVPSVTMATVSTTVTSISNFSVIVNSCLSLNIKDLNLEQQISLYPNPASNLLNINTSTDFSIIASTIFDVTGKLVSSNKHQISIDVSKLNAGIYFIKVQTDKGELKQKFIKE